jgi:hypothetical protein
VLHDKLVAALGVDRSRDALREVLRFLALTAEASEPLTPSLQVDRAWHELILCTRTYASLCQQLAGRFLHHEPGGAPLDHQRQFARTLLRYRARFGEPDRDLWGTAPLPACGGCESSI